MAVTAAVLSLLLCCITTVVVHATPFGAPTAACVSMTPQHGAAPQSGPPVYSLIAARVDTNHYTVTIQQTAGIPFKGFLIQARAQGSTVPLGYFEEPLPLGTKFLPCSAPTDSVTHNSNAAKDQRTFTWNSGGAPVAGVRFVATACLDYITFWVSFESAELGAL